jgi:hypothetical protein
MPRAQQDQPPGDNWGLFDWLTLIGWSTVLVAILLLVAMVTLAVVLLRIARATEQTLATQREQARDLAVLKRVLAGQTTPDFQVGDHVFVINGPHRGDYGVVIPPDIGLRQGYAYVELTGARERRYLSNRSLAPIDTQA